MSPHQRSWDHIKKTCLKNAFLESCLCEENINLPYHKQIKCLSMSFLTKLNKGIEYHVPIKCFYFFLFTLTQVNTNCNKIVPHKASLVLQCNNFYKIHILIQQAILAFMYYQRTVKLLSILVFQLYACVLQLHFLRKQ